MPKYVAEVELTFESEQEGVGAAFRRLQQAAKEAGFELRRGKASPAPPEDDEPSGPTRYVPLIDDDG
jgi:hypothetical protein